MTRKEEIELLAMAFQNWAFFDSINDHCWELFIDDALCIAQQIEATARGLA